MEPFEFERNTYTGKEIKDRINYYAEKAKEGKYLATSNQKNAMIILRELKDNIEKEYNYYDKGRFEKNVNALESEVINTYIWAIRSVKGNLSETNILSKAAWNLDYISEEMTYINTDIINECELYGNYFFQNVIKRQKEKGISDNEIKFLKSVKEFYGRPSQSTAKRVVDDSEGFSEEYIKEYVNLLLYKNVAKQK